MLNSTSSLHIGRFLFRSIQAAQGDSNGCSSLGRIDQQAWMYDAAAVPPVLSIAIAGGLGGR